MHELQGIVVPTVKEAQHLVQSQQYELHGLRAPNYTTSTQNPSTQILFILRKQRTDRPQWYPIKEIIDQCTSIGFQYEAVKSAITTLENAGFLEVQEELVRVIPLN